MFNLVVLNGPPRSGKDTVADLLEGFIVNSQQFTCSRHKFTSPMDEVLQYLVENVPLPNLGFAEFKQVREELKDEPILFGDQTPRAFLIDFSENFVKKYFGPAAFGFMALNELHGKDRHIHLFSDGGFKPEVKTLFNVGVRAGGLFPIIIQIHREGTNFEGDSRGYLDLTQAGYPLIHLINNGDLEDLEKVCYNLFHDLFLREPGHELLADENESVDDDTRHDIIGVAGPVIYFARSGEPIDA